MVEKLKKKIKEHFSNGPKAILIVVVILMIASIVITNMRKTIIVSIDGKESQKLQHLKNICKTLTSKNIQVGPKDKVQPQLDAEIKDGSKLSIKKAVKVNVEVDGKKLAIQSAENNIGDMLKKRVYKLKNLIK
ncbi:ubiquitin-like domain-containing protein [Clostridium botulinum]|nr:ubiquitin-like domain-containing protein [Clostridium botulinum]